jgi:hypothetical protein
MMLLSSARAGVTTLPKVDTKCTTPSLIPTVDGNTVRSFSTHGQQSAAKGSSTTVSRSDIPINSTFGLSAHGLVRRWLFIGYFPIHLKPPPHLSLPPGSRRQASRNGPVSETPTVTIRKCCVAVRTRDALRPVHVQATRHDAHPARVHAEPALAVRVQRPCTTPPQREREEREAVCEDSDGSNPHTGEKRASSVRTLTLQQTPHHLRYHPLLVTRFTPVQRILSDLV